MPWTKSHDQQSNTTIFTAAGVVTAEELRAGVGALRADLPREGGRRQFCDFAQVDRFEVTDETESQLIGSQGRPHPGMKVAVLLFHPQGSARVRKLIQQISTGTFRVFIDRREAVAWLNEGTPPETHLRVEDTQRLHRTLSVEG